MRSVLALAICALAVLAAPGCGKQVNPEYCESALHLDDPICHNSSIFLDAAIDAPLMCTSSAMCVNTPDPVCDTGKNICVGCTMNSQCTLDKPICDLGPEQCRGCQTDAECPGTGARCLPSGRCADASEIVYVDSSGSDNSQCTQTDPCNTINRGISVATANSKQLIYCNGKFTENVKFDNVGPLQLVCTAGTSLNPTEDQQNPMLEFGGSAVADVWRLTINATVTTPVQLTQGGSQKVGLYEMVIQGPPAPTGDTGTRGQAPGVLDQSGTLTMEWSIVSGFEPVGIEIDSGAGAFDLEDNFISDNGYQKNGNGGMYGGVAILNTATSTFAWNTVAFNGNSNNGIAPGVYCASGLLASTSVGNLFFHNQGGSPNEYSTACQISNSSQGTDPKFKKPSLPYDLHLTPASGAVIDKAGQTCKDTYDIDQQSRPYGAQCDFGADEYQP